MVFGFLVLKKELRERHFLEAWAMLGFNVYLIFHRHPSSLHKVLGASESLTFLSGPDPLAVSIPGGVEDLGLAACPFGRATHHHSSAFLEGRTRAELILFVNVLHIRLPMTQHTGHCVTHDVGFPEYVGK